MNTLPRHGGRMRLLACVTAVATSGCSTLTNPYLDTSALNKGPECARTQTCSAAQRFIGIRDAVVKAQEGTRTAYVERAELNSWSSALAFPLTGLLLYGAATRSSEGARKGILGGGLLMGSAYEARNALMSGSPETTYLLAEARLACVVDEAAKYNLTQPDAKTCNGKMDTVTKQIGVVGKLTPTAEMAITRDAHVTAARSAIAQYTGLDRTISAAADRMQAAARKIVTDTNFQIKTPSVSPATATALMKSEMAMFQSLGKLDESRGSQTGDGTTPDQDVAEALNALNDAVIDFAAVCVIPEPQSPAGFDSCTTFSPAVPALPTITVSPTGTQLEMSPGATRTFTVTSTPSGTPWADYGGDPSAANVALGRPQIVTLTPTQSQVTLNYTKAVAKDTQVILSLYTIGVAGNAVPLAITLKPDGTGKGNAEGVASAAASDGVDPAIAKLMEDKCLLMSIDPHPTDVIQLGRMLGVKWRTFYPGGGEPKPAQLTDNGFLQKIKASAKPRPPECTAK